MGAGYGGYGGYGGYDPYGQAEMGQRAEKELRKGIFSKVLISLIVAANLVFTAAVLFIFCFTYSEPSTLVMAWFGFTTGELWALAFVKKQKLKKGEEKKDVMDGNKTSTEGGAVVEQSGAGTQRPGTGGGAETDSADQ